MSGPDGPALDPDGGLERDLERLLREDPGPAGVAALDARIERMLATGAPARTGWWSRSRGVIGAAAATLVVATAAVLAFGGVPAPTPAATPTSPAIIEAPGNASASPEPSPSPAPSVPPATVGPLVPPSPSETAPPTDEPTARPTARPTDEPTPRPTRKPTPRPTQEPQPGGEAEPTPRTYVGSGSLGSPLTVHGATLLMARTDVPADIGDVCAAKGWDTWAYAVHMTWKSPAGSVEPYIVAGEHAHNAIWWEARWKVNTDRVAVVCHKPGDSARVRAETTPDGIPLTTYVWKLAP